MVRNALLKCAHSLSINVWKGSLRSGTKQILSAWRYWAFTIILTLKVSSFVLLCLLSFFFIVRESVCGVWIFFFFCQLSYISATWSNLVAYLWHSLAIVLMDVEGVKSASRTRTSCTETRFLDGGQGKFKRKLTMLVLPAPLQDCYRSTQKQERQTAISTPKRWLDLVQISDDFCMAFIPV